MQYQKSITSYMEGYGRLVAAFKRAKRTDRLKELIPQEVTWQPREIVQTIYPIPRDPTYVPTATPTPTTSHKFSRYRKKTIKLMELATGEENDLSVTFRV